MTANRIPAALEAYRDILDHSPDITTIIDDDQVIRFESQRIQLLGYQPDQLIGRNVVELIHPDDWDAVVAGLASLENREYSSEVRFRFLHGDGSWHQLEAVARRFDVDGFSGVFASSRDVTEKHELLQELNQSNELFKATFDLSRNLLSITRPETGQFVDVNDQWIAASGYQREEVIGKTAAELGIWGDGDERTKIFERLARDGFISNFQTHSYSRNGERLELIVDARYIDVGGEQCLLMSASNITEQRAIEAQLRQAQKMEAMGQLTGGVAHDFNNILGIIYGNAELGARNGALDSEYVDAILKACDRGSALTQQLLAFSRKQTLSPASLNLTDMAGSLESLFQRTLGTNIDVSIDAPGDLWPCMADAYQMETALVNLALNARDAMPSGGRLNVELRNRKIAGHPELPPGEYVQIRFTDTGEGMSPEVVDKVFEPFFTTKDVGKGTGLGLSMIFGFVKQSGGTVSIDSTIGVGTTVTMIFPRATAGSDKAAAQRDFICEGEGERILLLEDNRELKHVLQTMLVNLNYRVVTAGDERELDAILEQNQNFDLMISDVLLPGEARGPEIVARVKKRLPALKVLFISGYAKSAVDQFESDHQLIMKPFSRAELSSAICKALDKTC